MSDDQHTESESEGLIGSNQRKLMRLVESINKSLAPKVTATFKGEEVILQADGKTVWLDGDFRIRGETATP